MLENLQATAEAWPFLLQGLWVTIQLTVMGSALALVLALVLGLMAGASHKALAIPGRIIIEFFRGTSLVVQLFFIFFVLPQFGLELPGMFVGVLALGLNYGAYCAEVVRGSIASVPQGQWEATTALSMSTRRTWTAVVIPQALRATVPALGNYAISMFKDTPFLLVIGVVEMVNAAQIFGGNNFRYVEAITLAGIIFLLASYPTSVLVRRLEKRLAYAY